MSTHPALRADKVERLKAVLGLGLTDDPPTDDPPAEPADQPAATTGEAAGPATGSDQAGDPTPLRPWSEPAAAGQMARRAVRAALPRVRRLLGPVLGPARDRAARFVQHHTRAEVERVTAELEARHRALEAAVVATRAELHGVLPAAGALQSLSMASSLVLQGDTAMHEAQAVRVNSELLKAELTDVHRTLEQLGRALSPDAGLPRAAERFSELRERVDAIDRRVRRLASTPALATDAGSDPGSDQSADQAAGGPPVDDGGFDYVGLERRFRGDSETVHATLVERYADLLAPHAPVLDVGCGRGELLAALGAAGVEGQGVDLNAEMVDEARARGVEAVQGDVVDFLEGLERGQIGSIIAVHVAEHLPLGVLTRFLELAAEKVRPGGLVVLETPNPASLIVLGNSFILDPTHVWPLHPALLSFMAERAGFRQLRLEYFSPAEGYHLPLIEGVDEPWAATVNEALGRLNDVLFGPQEYALVATAPPEPPG